MQICMPESRFADALLGAQLDRVLAVLHQRGVVNEDALVKVCGELVAGAPLERDHLIQIFGVTPVYHLMTTKDETARELVRQAADAMFNHESRVSLKDWLHAAETLVGPITVRRRWPVRPEDVDG